MKRVAILSIVLALSVGMLASGGQQNKKGNRHFLGLWEGVDINDGSKRTISITDHDGDGILIVASRDTYWTLCDGDRGLELASGGVRHDGILATDGTVTCFESMIERRVMQTYEFSGREGTLVATPNVPQLHPITLHRVSN